MDDMKESDAIFQNSRKAHMQTDGFKKGSIDQAMALTAFYVRIDDIETGDAVMAIGNQVESTIDRVHFDTENLDKENN